jgi:hypothetical protein
MADSKTFMIENAPIVFRNFTGKGGPFNPEGDRNFCVLLEPEHAEFLAAEGWNVKTLDPREEGAAPQPYIQVRVNFDQRPPRVVMLTESSRTALNSGTVGSLDWADIKKADLICRGYEWEVQGKTGVKAYLKSLFVTIEEDELERKYGINTADGQAHDG